MNPYATYKQQSVSTMTNVEIVIKGYDECVKLLNRAVQYIEAKELVQAHNSLDKASELVLAFRTSLDMSAGGEISKNLDSLYEYYFNQIITADMKKDVSIIHAILPDLMELRDAFVQISAMPKVGIVSAGNVLTGTAG
jgi:flagellar protein FliS